MPIMSWGPFTFSSGWTPQDIQGPERQSLVAEHQVPGKEGGVVEYLGSKQPTYQLRGFLAPRELVSDNAGAILSGTSYIGLNTDDARDTILNLRGSGAQLLRIESTLILSGLRIMYENGFFYATNITFGYEAGHSYPYYPYTIDLKGASTKTYGNSSGTNTLTSNSGVFFSGYIRDILQTSGLALGELVQGMGLYVDSVASGNAKVAMYTAAGALKTQSASQAVHSGWNYFPLRPSFTTTSGTTYVLAFKGDAANSSGFNIRYGDFVNSSGASSFKSGITYSDDFPDPYALGAFSSVSGLSWNLVFVVT